MKITHVKVQTNGKRKYRVLHDQKIAPSVTDKQLIAALKQQYDLVSFTVENGNATAIVGKLEVKSGE